MTSPLDITKIAQCSQCLIDNDFVSALTLSGEFLAENEDHPYGILFLALTAYLMEDTERSIQLLEKTHEAYPDNQEVVDALAVVYGRSGNLNESLYYAKLATALTPDPLIHELVPYYFRDYANTLNASYKTDTFISATIAYEKSEYEKCVKLCRNTIKSNPNNWDAYIKMGMALMKLHGYQDAITSFQTALSGMQKPQYNALIQIGICHTHLAQFEDALFAFQVAAKFCDQSKTPANDYSYILELISSLPCDTKSFMQELQQKVKDIVLEDVDEAILIGGGEDIPSRKIRVSYISDSFYDCSKGQFIERALTGHDKSKFEIYCYQQNSKSDATTSRIKALVDDWRDISDLDDLTAAYLITCDSIDILVDTIGIGFNQRLNVLAQKPAPIILSWLNQVGADAICETDGTLISANLTNGGLSFDVDTNLLKMDHNIRQERADGTAIIFTASCDLSTVSYDTISAWAEILLKTDNSNIVIGGPGCNFKAQRDRFTGLFMNYGLADRLFFQNSQNGQPTLSNLLSMSDIHMCAFNDTDANNAAAVLSSGTPLLVLDRNISSSLPSNAELLRHCGKTQWLASSPEDYVEKAHQLAINVEMIDKQKNYNEIKDSKPFQVKTLSQDLEDAYIEALKTKELI